MESFSWTIKEYFPFLSVTVPLPDVDSTLTDSRPIVFDKSSTVPLTLTCAIAEKLHKTNMTRI